MAMVMVEKRKTKRVEIGVEIKYQSFQKQNWYSTITKNIGMDGICLISKEYLGRDSEIKVKLNLNDEDVKMIVLGITLWSNFINGSGMYEAGIEFTEIGENEKKQILRKIAEINQKKFVE